MAQPYSISLLNDLHAHFPDLLYRPTQFHNVGDVLNYIIRVARRNPYEVGQAMYAPASHVPASQPRALHVPASLPQVVHAPPPLSLAPLAQDDNIDQLYQILYGSSASSSFSRPSLLSSMLRSAPVSSASSFMSSLFDVVPNPAVMEPVIVRPTEQQIRDTTVLTRLNPHPIENCAICQDSMEDGQSVRILSHCIHRFHQECIDTWFQNHVTCPTCRHDIRDH